VLAFGPLEEMDDEDMEGAPSFARQSVRFAFARTNGSCLTVLMPAPLIEAMARPAETNGPVSGRAMRGASEMVEALDGMDVEIAVEVRGRVLAHNASRPDAARPGRFVLFRLTDEKFSEDPSLARQMGEEPHGMDGADAYMMRFLKLAGALVETNRPVTIQFK
jgi:hypothetical protein